MGSVVPVEYVRTSDAFEGLLLSDESWCRLSDKLHVTPLEKRTQVRRAYDKRQEALLAPIYDAIAGNRLTVLLLERNARHEWVEHPLPSTYSQSRQMPDAIYSGLAERFRLTHDDIRFVGKKLFFRASDWERFLKPEPARLAGRKRTRRDEVVSYLQHYHTAGVPGSLKNTALLENLKQAGINVGEKTLQRAMKEHHSSIAKKRA